MNRISIPWRWKIISSCCRLIISFCLSCNMTKPAKWPVCPAKTLISLCICRCLLKESLCPQLPIECTAQQRLWSDRADARTDLSVHCMQLPLCLFCCATAHVSGCCRDLLIIIYVSSGIDQVSLLTSLDLNVSHRLCLHIHIVTDQILVWTK